MNAAKPSSGDDDHEVNVMVGQVLDQILCIREIDRDAVGELLVALADELGGIDELLCLFDTASKRSNETGR